MDARAILRRCAMVAGISAAIAFAVVGPLWRLQEYGDGSLFSYAVAAQDVWAFHWHNIAGRMTPWLLTMLPGELYVAATGDAIGGIDIYGALFFAAPLAGLVATFFADRSRGGMIFAFACASTAIACPLVFGFPTEMCIAQALFWPALALVQDARGGIVRFSLIFLLLLALILCHPAAVPMGVAVVMSAGLRGVRSFECKRAAAAFALAFTVWLTVKITLPPDAYFEAVLARAALHFFDPARLVSPLMLTLEAALASYVALLLLLRRYAVAPLVAVAAVALALTIYWLAFDASLHTQDRYFMRTILFALTLVFGALASLYAVDAEQRIEWPVPLIRFALDGLENPRMLRAATGALALVALIHTVETVKFIDAWSAYRTALRALAMSEASDAGLGDPHFVSADRIDPMTNRMSWNSTTPYLSVLVAPGLSPRRLVIDPAGNYFWLTCAAATRSVRAARSIPERSRMLLRVFACRHRRP